MAYSTTSCIVLNFETTSELDNPDYPLEIIQFSARIIDLESNTIRENESFNKFVRPRINKNLTQYCIEQTGVQQASVDSANEFPVVYEEFIKWVKSLFPRLADVSLLCATYDVICKKMQYQCLLSGILMSPLFYQYVSLEKATQDNRTIRATERKSNKSYYQRITERYNMFPTGNINGNDRCFALARVVTVLVNNLRIPMRINCALTCIPRIRRNPLSAETMRNWKTEESSVNAVWYAALPFAHNYMESLNPQNQGICAGCRKDFSYCSMFIRANGHQQKPRWLYENPDLEIVFARTANLY